MFATMLKVGQNKIWFNLLVWTCSKMKWTWNLIFLPLSWNFKHLQQCSICDPAKIFVTSKFMYPFATPPIKLKLRQQIGGGLLIANHLNQSLWWTNQKCSLSSNYIIFIVFFFACAHQCCAFYQPWQHVELCRSTKTIFLNQTSICWNFFIQFYCGESYTKHHQRCYWGLMWAI